MRMRMMPVTITRAIIIVSAAKEKLRRTRDTTSVSPFNRFVITAYLSLA
jgi:hypothetical protein